MLNGLLHFNDYEESRGTRCIEVFPTAPNSILHTSAIATPWKKKLQKFLLFCQRLTWREVDQGAIRRFYATTSNTSAFPRNRWGSKLANHSTWQLRIVVWKPQCEVQRNIDFSTERRFRRPPDKTLTGRLANFRGL
ncbi:hypothetical protein TNCV_4441951 [Trichonephila clavipes]|nr:hypothetical protein TNCV_4441951 [Trichonephila clavipes]